MTNFWAKTTIILSVLAKIFYLPVQKQNYLQFYDVWLQKKGRTKKNFPLLGFKNP
jgi:hypothetical protein